MCALCLPVSLNTNTHTQSIYLPLTVHKHTHTHNLTPSACLTVHHVYTDSL